MYDHPSVAFRRSVDRRSPSLEVPSASPLAATRARDSAFGTIGVDDAGFGSEAPPRYVVTSGALGLATAVEPRADDRPIPRRALAAAAPLRIRVERSPSPPRAASSDAGASPPRSGAGRSTRTAAGSLDPDLLETRKQRRLAKNRASAATSRKRKAAYVRKLETENAAAHAEIARVTGERDALAARNTVLEGLISLQTSSASRSDGFGDARTIEGSAGRFPAHQ